MTALAVLVISATQASAQDSTYSNENSSTFLKSNETSNIAATNRSQALITDSMHYALPHEDMTYMELGAYNQRQKARLTDATADSNAANNQAFYFKHSRGLYENLALDFNLDYFMQEENAFGRSTGVNEGLLGLRSNFEAAGLTWVYGGNLTYIPDGEYGDADSKVAVAAKIGFEEAVDIARWGFETEASTKDSAFFQNQLNLIGFFEMPFIKNLNMGVTAGADITKISASQQNNFAKVYGQFNLDAVSGAQVSFKQTNQKNESASLSESEIGAALNRVF